MEHRMPDHRRKNMSRAPIGDSETPNEWAIGHGRALKLVASLERAGHQTMIARLSFLLRTTVMSKELTQEVQKEIAVRKELAAECTRIVNNAQARIDQQYDKQPRHVPPEERIAPTVPGPAGHTAVTATAAVNLSVKAIDATKTKHTIRKSDAGKEAKRQAKFDTTTLSSIFR